MEVACLVLKTLLFSVMDLVNLALRINQYLKMEHAKLAQKTNPST